MDMKKLTEHLLVDAGMNKTELAQKMGISRQALCNNLNRDMRISTFFKMVDEMGYKLYYTKDGKTMKKL